MFTIARARNPEAVRRILTALPAWFGIPEAIDGYVDDSARLPSYLAIDSDIGVIGVSLLNKHFEATSEVHLIAVEPTLHRSGVGAALLQAMETDLRASGDRILQVHTCGPSFPSPEYARTRAFYLAMGFYALQEFTGIDWDGPTLILVKPL